MNQCLNWERKINLGSSQPAKPQMLIELAILEEADAVLECVRRIAKVDPCAVVDELP